MGYRKTAVEGKITFEKFIGELDLEIFFSAG